ncbi:MAG: type II toxin-antitoxin system prevent-host-death family antitoxin [Burkholderiales bacterium]
MSALTFRNKRGELVDIVSIPATTMKNQFASCLDQAIRGNPVAITKHDNTKAILISIEEFEALTGERSRSLDTLGAQFDGLLARMQTPSAKKGVAAAFNASPQALGRAALKAVRK